MCYNKESSLKIFLITLFASIFLFIRNYENDRLLAVIFIIVSLMQLAEYFMWTDQQCGLINNNATKFALIVLLIQPLFFLLSVYLYGNITISKKIILYLLFVVLLLSSVITYYTITYNKNILCSKPRYVNGHLNWDIDKILKTVPSIITTLFFILYFLSPLILLFLKSKIEGLIYILLYSITLLFSIYLNKGYGGSWKSFWCYTVNYIPLLAILIGWYFHHYPLK